MGKKSVGKTKAPKKTWKPGRATSKPVSDRKQFLAMLTPSVISDIKEAAREDGRPAWEIMEEAAVTWLAWRRKAGG
jgi:hypothetical protein